MDPQVTSALAAVLGALVGGLASLTSTWIGERSRDRRDLLHEEIVKRETAYGEFIHNASELYATSATHMIDDDGTEVARLASLYSLASRIRLFASDQVILEAERVVDLIIAQYGNENISPEQLRTNALEKKGDPLKLFSVTCRQEIKDLIKAF